MRAITLNEFGSNDVLQLSDVDEPLVGPDTVLIRTKTVGVNPVDWKVVRGYLAGAFPTHFPLVPCWDIAGVVEKVGPAVVEFAPGDEVVAYNRQDHVQNGTPSELVAVPIRCVGHKAEGVDWARAGAIPLAGLTAYQAIEAAEIEGGDTVLVHNAAGGVGSFAVQLAAHRGARVIGTASTKNHDYLAGLGAEPVQYGEGLVNEVREIAPLGIDVALDFAGGDALSATQALLGDHGRAVSIVDADRVLKMGGTYVFVRPNGPQLTELTALVGSGLVKVEIAAEFPFEKTSDAFALSEEGHVRGKIVITFD